MSASAASPWPGPLAGVRVLDFTRVLAGPAASLALADLGAEVIKVEPLGGEPMRYSNPLHFAGLNRTKASFAIDLKNVLLVDREAVKLLALSEANGTELRNCPPYIREWVTRERAEMPEHPSDQGLEGREDIEDV